MSHVHDVIVANAERLLDDARLLYEYERFQSCAALAILAIEECGKAQLIGSMDTDNNIQYRLRNHVLKQQCAMSVYQAGTLYKAIMRLFFDIFSTMEIPQKLKDQILLAMSSNAVDQDALANLLSVMGVGPNTTANAMEATTALSATGDPFRQFPNFIKKVRQSGFPENTLRQYLVELTSSLQIMCSDMESYLNDGMSLHKHSGLYVDVGESEMKISSAIAERYIRIADQTIKLLRSSAPRG